uniref:ATP synthase F0 subunit 8 n=1 Tax=Dusuna sp. TaxID=3133678 RepID=A0AAU6PBZ6_9HEMI
MPQMSPLWWLFLLFFFIFYYMFILCIVYFINLTFCFNVGSCKLNHFFWSW